MGIKQDRPADYGDDGVVVYVAKSKDEVDQARDALGEAGIDVNLPEAAIEALFASGRSSLPIRVAAMDFKKAQDVIDEVFPPPVIDLPPLPGQEVSNEVDEGDGRGGAGAASGGGGGGGGPQLDTYRPEPTAGKGSIQKLEASANKVLFIALASFILPGLGVLTAIFAGISGYWCLDRLPYDSSARGRARAALVLAVCAVLAQAGLAAYVISMRG